MLIARPAGKPTPKGVLSGGNAAHIDRLIELGFLTERWYPLRPHPAQASLWTSPSRFKVVPAGRRSGKTEHAKRFTVVQAVLETRYPDPWFVLGAPVRDQAKRIYWDDLKAMIGPKLLAGKPRESELTVKLITGAEISVVGMDEPSRIEGRSLNGIVLDEYANMKKKVWTDNVRPALSDRGGWAWLIGVPEGRNHYHDIYQDACLCQPDPATQIREWEGFTWLSSDILPPEEIASAKASLDELTYQQEYEARFISYSGRAYYAFTMETHVHSIKSMYDPNAPLLMCFDFNVDPGVAVVAQEIKPPEAVAAKFPPSKGGIILPASVAPIPHLTGETVTGVLGEVWIPQNSTTEAVCRKLVQDWSHHKGLIHLYGDSTGGNRGTAKLSGSDWDIVERVLSLAFPGRVRRLYKTNPPERARINAVNSRLRTMTGTMRMLFDPSASRVIKDMEGVTLLEGGAGEINKAIERQGLNHISSALGYYIAQVFPTTQHVLQSRQY